MKPIYALKSRSPENNLEVQQEDGDISRLGFEWKEPATNEEILTFEKENKLVLPGSYKEFLKISNGAILFKDREYGQWGCNILELGQVTPKTREMIKRGFNWRDSWIVFATWIGDLDVLIFDLEEFMKGSKNYILDGDAGYQTDEWEYIKGDFSKWIDRLIISQGTKYWRWY